MPPSPSHAPDGSALVRAGTGVELRAHVLANREPFVRWYGDPDIARLLRHDLRPLSRRQAISYFDGIIMPLSRKGHCWAIHRRDTGQLIGTAAVTEIDPRTRACLYRIVIGERDVWDQGFGTEATRLVAAEVFERLPVDRIRLEVFAHNPRARAAYDRVGFVAVDRYQEHIRTTDTVIDIIAMELTRDALASNVPRTRGDDG